MLGGSERGAPCWRAWTGPHRQCTQCWVMTNTQCEVKCSREFSAVPHHTTPHTHTTTQKHTHKRQQQPPQHTETGTERERQREKKEKMRRRPKTREDEEKRRGKMKDEKRLFLFFRMFRISPFLFPIVFMIRIRFLGLRESFQQGFRVAQCHTG